MTGYIRNGRGSVRPYVYGPASVEAMVLGAFGARELERNDDPGSVHIEVGIGDSVLTLSLWKKARPPAASAASVYVYVPDADAAYVRALQHGATSVRAPVDAPYGERTATVIDDGGNQWFIATFHG